MITFIRGELIAEEEDGVIIDVVGIGYKVFMTSADMANLPAIRHEILVHTYFSVKEDAMRLFGFLDRESLSIFKLLIGVNGVGPKGALAILTNLTPDNLRFAVLSHDVKAISGSQGIGKKTAEKVILELRDKLDIEEMIDGFGEKEASGSASVIAEDNRIRSEAIQALEALGYGSTESLKAVKQVEIDENSTSETVLKMALKFMM